MKLSFEKSRPGHSSQYIPEIPQPISLEDLPECFRRRNLPRLPELSENEISRHYTELENRTFGVNDGPYLLGSCTMKYNPKVNDLVASLPAFTDLHPLAPEESSRGARAIMVTAESLLTEITGMDRMTFAPMAGAQGEFTALLMIHTYFEHQGEERTKILVPDTAHGTNPASAAMAGFDVINLPSNDAGGIEIAALRSVLEAEGDKVAGLMLTNPNTLGLLDPNIQSITQLVHEAGGINYYDGANLNPIMGVSRPGDMGFDLVHLNLHKTFSTPHGGGGPGSGPVGCKTFLAPFLPLDLPTPQGHEMVAPKPAEWLPQLGDLPEIPLLDPAHSCGRVGHFFGNFLVVVRALCYILRLVCNGIPEAAQQAVLNANYLQALLRDILPPRFGDLCMHEFVVSLEDLKQETGVDARAFAKAMQDEKIHPPTMYFPLNVSEALMIEPTETESKDRLDQIATTFHRVYAAARNNPSTFAEAPRHQVVSAPDETLAARHPVLRYNFEESQEKAGNGEES